MPSVDHTPAPLRHLVRLSHQVERAPHAQAIAVYAESCSTTSLDSGALIESRAAETGFEGVACVDDVARAALLALEYFEGTNDATALSLAEGWLAFVEYMQLPDGRFCNFILDWSGRQNERGTTSIAGGQWWTSRALWALGHAYRITGKPSYRSAFERGWTSGSPRNTDITAVILLGTLAFLRRHPASELYGVALDMARTIAATTVDGYLVHHPGESVIHLWGYDQVTALVEAADFFEEPALLDPCIATAERVFKRLALEGPFRSFPIGDRDGLCVYDVSGCCRGLGALHGATGQAKYLAWLALLIRWLDGANVAREPLYDRADGRCYDGIDGKAVNHNCGAEAAIEAGFVELERLRRLAWLKTRRPTVRSGVQSLIAAPFRAVARR